MAEYIKTLKEDNGDITYPVTQAGAVLLSGGGDLETTLNAKASQTAVDGKIDIGDVQSSDIVANAVTTAKIADRAVTTAKLAAGIVTMTRTVLFNNSSGVTTNITVSRALNNFDEVEFWFIDTNQIPNQLIRTIPGDALAIVLDIPHPGGSNTVFWNLARWYWTAGSTTLTKSGSHYQKVLSTTVSTQAADFIKIRKIVGIKFVSN